MKKVDAFLATAIFGSAQFDEPEVLDDVVGDEVDDQLQQLFDSFFDRAALERLQLCKSDSLAKTSSLAKAGIPRKFGIARVETGEIDNTIWAVAFDADGNLVDQQEIGPGPLGKRSSDFGWDDEIGGGPRLEKRSKVARIHKSVIGSTTVIAELDADNHVLKTYIEGKH